MTCHSNNINKEKDSFCENQRNPWEFPIKKRKILVVITGALTGLCFSALTASAASPAYIALGSNSVKENTTVSTPIGKLSTTDSDARETFTYSIETATVPFQINSSRLEAGGALSFVRTPSYNISIRNTHAGCTSYDRIRAYSRLFKIGPKAE